MTAMLLFALQFSLLEARLRLIRATLASCLSRFPLHRLPLIRERLLRLGAHRRLLEGFRRLAGASLGVLRGLARLGRIVTEERELRPFACNESQDLLIGRFCAEDDAGDAVPAVLDMLGLCFKKCALWGYSPPVFSGHMELAPNDPRTVFLRCSILSHASVRS